MSIADFLCPFSTKGVALITELQSASHFAPITLWDAAKVFPIYSADRFEERLEDGRISVAAVQRARAANVVFWADQLLGVAGNQRQGKHPYRDGFTYTFKGSTEWRVLPFEMAACLTLTPPVDCDFDYVNLESTIARLANALPKENLMWRAVYATNLLDIEIDEFWDWYNSRGILN